MMVSLSGGLIGIVTGVAIPLSAGLFADVKIPLSPVAVVVAFGVSRLGDRRRLGVAAAAYFCFKIASKAAFVASSGFEKRSTLQAISRQSTTVL
jgi:hypothetical protein